MMLLMQLVYVLLLFRTSMRRLLLIGLLAGLLGASPAARAPVLNGGESEAACDRLINSTNPTLWLDSSKLSSITAADNAVSAWASRSGTISFVQATEANKPKLTRGDNLENRQTNSADLSGSEYNFVNATRNDTTKFTPTASAGYCFSRFTSLAGVTYRVSFDARRVTGATSVRFLNLNSASGNTQALTIDGTLKRYSFEFLGKTGGGTIDFGIQDNANPSDWSQIEYTNVQLQSALADPTYLPTTTAPQYRGVNGRPAVFFDGVDDVMTSSATLGDVFAAGAKTLITGFQPLQAVGGINARIFTDTGPMTALYTSGDTTVWWSSDGSADFSVWSPLVNGKNYLLSGTHDGTNLDSKVNGSVGSTDAGGSTSTMTGTLKIGGSGTASQWFAGPITDVITWNKVLPASTISQITRCKARQRGADLR